MTLGDRPEADIGSWIMGLAFGETGGQSWNRWLSAQEGWDYLFNLRRVVSPASSGVKCGIGLRFKARDQV